MSDGVVREKIVAAARDVLLTDGYEAATPEAVSRKAGVSSPEFSAAFSGRQELVLAALEAHWEDLSRFLDGAFSAELPPLDRLRRFCEGAYRFQDHHWNRLGCVVGCLLLRVGSAASREDGPIRERVAEYLS